MKTLNKSEIDSVVGGMLVAGPGRPRPLPAGDPVTLNGGPAYVAFLRR